MGERTPFLLILSTGLNAPTKQRCIDSVKSQRRPHHHWGHAYVEAGKRDPPKCALQNVVEALDDADLDPCDIVISLDGDDWFAHDGVLEMVAEAYRDPQLWLTYGSFRYADGRPGFAEEIPAAEWNDLRRAPWRASHLKTYCYGLFAQLTDSELKRPDGGYRFRAWDQALMLPMLEMAGAGHCRFLADVSYVYNFANAYEFTEDAAGLAAERAEAAEIRALPRRERISSIT